MKVTPSMIIEELKKAEELVKNNPNLPHRKFKSFLIYDIETPVGVLGVKVKL